MNILFIAQTTLKKELGGSKVVIELAEAINESGHFAKVVGPDEIKDFLLKKSLPVSREYASNINIYLKEVADNFDIIDVDANHLYKFDRSDTKSVIVARSVLFIPHLQYIKWPQKKSLTYIINQYIRKYRFGEELRKKIISRFYLSLNNADLINVSNDKDVNLLLAKGYSKDKILNLPYGLNSEKRERLAKTAETAKEKNNIVFIGTFDHRKGCMDLPKIYERIKRQVTDANLILLGAKGFFQETHKIYKFFPEELHSSIKIILTYKEFELPGLLKEAKIAVFPSYLEGFGFSVIESMGAGIPVIAYNSPGPSSILKESYLTEPGDWKQMSDKAVYYLKNEMAYKKASIEMLQDSAEFDWELIGKKTTDIYAGYMKKKIESPV